MNWSAICWPGMGQCVHFSLTNTNVHTYTFLQGPPSPSCLKLFCMREENSKTKGSHWPAHNRNINQSKETESQGTPYLHEQILHVFSNSPSISALKCPELQEKGNILTLLSLHPRGRSRAVSCPGCPDRYQKSLCPNQSHFLPVGTFPATAFGLLWDGSTDPDSQNVLSSLQKDPVRNAK